MAPESNVAKSKADSRITLVDVDASNWRDVAGVTPRPDHENMVARGLYACLGFIETGELTDDELVARRRVRQVTGLAIPLKQSTG